MNIMRGITPGGLYARSLLIVIFPLVALMIASTYIFFDSHWRQVSRKLAESVTGDIAFLIALHKSDPEGFDDIAVMARSATRLSIKFRPDDQLPTNEKRSLFSVLDQTLQRELSDGLDDPFWFDATRYSDYIDIRVQLDSGVMRALAYRDRTFATTGHIFLFWVFGTSAIFGLMAVLFLNNQVRSILQLAAAAKAYGRGEEIPDFKPTGADEVRQAARAVIEMKDRIRAHIAQRTMMLAGVSHDLRTPLTRLKLQLALLPESQDIIDARQDLTEMEAMLDEYLAFAKGEKGEHRQKTRLSEIISHAAKAAGERAKISMQLDIDPQMQLRRQAMTRCLANLINNAADHGDYIEISIISLKEKVIIRIDDNGPGLDETLYDEVFKPFWRSDMARNQNIAGVGLGMAIARDIARSHGGDVNLDKSPMGGLRAVIHLIIE